MKDKEKQIEEIEIRELARVFMNANCKGSECENCLFIKSVKEAEETCVCLKAVYNAGYRKINKDSILLSKTDFDLILPPNSVVLTRGEYDKLKSRADNKCRYDCDLIDMPDFEREKTLIEKTSKETAEKIIKIVGNVCEKHMEYAISKIKYRSAEELYCSAVKSFTESLKKELAKQLVVEVKE